MTLPTAFRRSPAARSTRLVVAILASLSAFWIGPVDAPIAAAASCPSSLQAAIDRAPSGSTLTIGACTYHEAISIRKPLTLKATGATIDGDDSRSRGVEVSASDVTIDGLTVQRVKSDTYVGAVNVSSGDRFVFKNGIVRDSSTICIALARGSGMQVVDSEMARCGKEGYFVNGATGATFTRNWIHHNNPNRAFDPGIEAGAGKVHATNGVRFFDNVISYNRGRGIWYDGFSRDAVVRGNQAHHNDNEGIMFEISTGATISDNAVWNNGFAFATWGYGAGILISSSDGALVEDNTVAWNARGISVIDQGRQLAPSDHNVVHDNLIVSSSGDHVAGWYDDKSGGLWASGNANSGSDNRYWISGSEPQSARFVWHGDHSTLSSYNATPGEQNASYLSQSQRDAALADAGIPNSPNGATPTAAMSPKIVIATGQLGSGTIPARIDWKGVTAASAYEIQLQKNGGAWTAVTAPAAKETSVRLRLDIGASYRAKVRYKGDNGTWSSWVPSPATSPARYEETSSKVTFTPSWDRLTSAEASDGHVEAASTTGAGATFRFTGRGVGWVAPLGYTKGRAKVFIDGALRETVDLSHAAASRRVVFYWSWSSKGSHTMVIQVEGTSGHPRVDVDALLVMG